MKAGNLEPALRRSAVVAVALTIVVLAGVLVVEKATAQVCTSEDNLFSSVDGGVAPVLTDVWSDEDGGLPSDAAKVFDMDSGTYWNSDWFGAGNEPTEGYGDHSYLVAEFSSPEIVNQFAIEQDPDFATGAFSEALDIYVTTDAAAVSSSLTGWTQVASLTGLGVGTEVVDISAATVLKAKLVFPTAGNSADARIREFQARLCGCSSDPECDDGLACNGAETCDTGSGNCLTGTPLCAAPCNGTCSEPSGACSPEPDNSPCDIGIDTCSELDECLGGVCVNVEDDGDTDTDDDGVCDLDDDNTSPGLFTLLRVKLRPDGASSANDGKATVVAHLADSDTEGGFVTNLLAGTSTMGLVDSGSFGATFPLENCSSPSPKQRRVRCRSSDGRVRATAKKKVHLSEHLFTLRIKAKKLTSAETGPAGATNPVAPVTGSLVHGFITRVDTIDQCSLLSAGENRKRLVCSE